MTGERDFAMALAQLAEAMGEQKLTPVRIETYYRNLRDIPHALLQATVDRMIQSIGSDSFRWTALPLVADIRKAAEQMRRELKAARLWQPCEQCADQHGWVEVEDHRGVTRLTRCVCVKAHQESLERAGLMRELAAVPPAAIEEPEPQPALVSDNAPPAVTDQIRALAAQKGWR